MCCPLCGCIHEHQNPKGVIRAAFLAIQECPWGSLSISLAFSFKPLCVTVGLKHNSQGPFSSGLPGSSGFWFKEDPDPSRWWNPTMFCSLRFRPWYPWWQDPGLNDHPKHFWWSHNLHQTLSFGDILSNKWYLVKHLSDAAVWGLDEEMKHFQEEVRLSTAKKFQIVGLKPGGNVFSNWGWDMPIHHKSGAWKP